MGILTKRYSYALAKDTVLIATIIEDTTVETTATTPLGDLIQSRNPHIFYNYQISYHSQLFTF